MAGVRQCSEQRVHCQCHVDCGGDVTPRNIACVHDQQQQQQQQQGVELQHKFSANSPSMQESQ